MFKSQGKTWADIRISQSDVWTLDVEKRIYRVAAYLAADCDMLKTEDFFVDISALKKAYLPMSEPMLYILLALNHPLHGYGIIKYVEELTEGRLRLGCGTLYGILGKLQKSGVICIYDESDHKILYELTSRGKALLNAEIDRIRLVCSDIEKVSGTANGL